MTETYQILMIYRFCRIAVIEPIALSEALIFKGFFFFLIERLETLQFKV